MSDAQPPPDRSSDALYSFPAAFTWGLVGFLARQLRGSGIVDYLQDRADHTDNPYDDYAVRMFSSLLDYLAEL